jgi:hypothetical protein
VTKFGLTRSYDRSSVARSSNISANSVTKVLAIAVGRVHTHVIVELPRERAKVKWIVGQAKRKASRAVKKWLPGSVWAAGGEYKIVKDKEHLINAVEYVIYEQGPGAWTLWYHDLNDDGMFGRKRPVSRRRRN